MEPYKIVVPSRARPKKCAFTLQCFPDAVAYVDERERADYRFLEPRVVYHKPTNGHSQMRNLLLHDFTEPCLIQVDDDFRGVRCIAPGRLKLITDPNVIMDIVENGIDCAVDLNIGMFGWNRSANEMMLFPGDPIGFVSPMFGTYGIRGAARYRKMDAGGPGGSSRFIGSSDVDLVLRTLLEDRIVYQDRRFYFDHGPVFSGRGGMVDIMSKEAYETGRKALIQKWGRYVSVRSRSKSAMGKGLTSKEGCSVRVRRRSPITEQ